MREVVVRSTREIDKKLI